MKLLQFRFSKHGVAEDIPPSCPRNGEPTAAPFWADKGRALKSGLRLKDLGVTRFLCSSASSKQSSGALTLYQYGQARQVLKQRQERGRTAWHEAEQPQTEWFLAPSAHGPVFAENTFRAPVFLELKLLSMMRDASKMSRSEPCYQGVQEAGKASAEKEKG